MDQQKARNLYRVGNAAGMGYAPYRDVAGDDTIDAAVSAAIADGWGLVCERVTSDDVVVLRNDGEMMAIGGDAVGNGAWAVIISDVDAALGHSASGATYPDEDT